MRADTTIRDAWAIAEAAFVRAYPLVTGRRAMALATAVSAPDPATMRAPLNTLVHGRDTPDTLRSSAWLDLADEPLVLTVPDTRGRYYALWLRDAWSDVFASVGARTTGTWRGAFALLGPRHHACALPQGLTPIAAPTRTVHLGGRLEAVGARPGEDLQWAYDGFRVVPLSQLRGPADSAPSLPILRDATAFPIEEMDATAFFGEVMRLAELEPPDLEVRVVLGRLRELVEREPLAPGLAVGLARGRTAVHAEAQRLRPLTRSGWMVDSGASPRGVDYVARAAAAHVGRDADPAADTVLARLDTDADGLPLSSDHRYVLRFAPDAPPPADGFWELTAYGGDPARACSSGDLHGLALDPDGALAVHVQREPPDRARRSNWLPTPAGAFSLALRLYWPRDEALEPAWSPPPLHRLRDARRPSHSA